MHKIESNDTSMDIEPYPFGKRFAVALIDDTDHARVEESRVAYQVLRDHGLRSTRTVWPLRCDPSMPGAELYSNTHTLEDPELRKHCTELAAAGFEIAMHTASGASNTRERTIAAYTLFEDVFGQPPITNVMHSRNLENIHWGSDLVPKKPWQSLIRLAESTRFHGHDDASDYFWGDLCREKTRYVRHLDSVQADSLGLEPATPFHDPAMPFVNWWFNAAYGAGTRLFDILSPHSIRELRRTRGASIVHCYLRHYTRTASNTLQPHARFLQTMKLLSDQSDGWYVPVSELLDRRRTLRSLNLSVTDGVIRIRNDGDLPLPQLAVRVHRQKKSNQEGMETRKKETNAFSQTLLGDLNPGQECHLSTGDHGIQTQSEFPSQPSYNRLATAMVLRIAWQIHHGRRYRVGRTQSDSSPPWVQELYRKQAEADLSASSDVKKRSRI